MMNEADSARYGRRDYNPPQYLTTQSAFDTPIKPTTWAIPDFFAKGELTALAGPKGSGKSTIYCAIAAAVSRGSSYLSWRGELNQDPGGVLIMSSEDDVERTIIPRLIAAEADLRRIQFIIGNGRNNTNSGPYTFNSEDNERIVNTARSMGGVSLVIIDPWSLVVDGDANNKVKVRRKLEKLRDLAKILDAAILIIGHVAKNSKGSDPITRFSGSSAVTEVSRCLFVTAEVENGPNDDGSTHVFVRAATNLGRVGGGMSYSIKGVEVSSNGVSVHASKIDWHSELQGRPEDILNDAEKTKNSKKLSAPEKAADFLREFLRDGERLYPEILNEATKIGISKISLDRAKAILKIKHHKQTGAGSASPSIWALARDSGESGVEASGENLPDE